MTFIRLFIALLFITNTAYAEPEKFIVNTQKTTVGFTYQFGNDTLKGEFKNYDIDLVIDFNTVSNSRVAVVLDTTTARAGFPFATQALKSKKVLNTVSYPTITFVSTSTTGKGNKALITGDVTVRGITKKMQLTATLFRPKGTEANSRDNLTIRLEGALNRHDFGASGFRKEVKDTLGIIIDAKVSVAK